MANVVLYKKMQASTSISIRGVMVHKNMTENLFFLNKQWFTEQVALSLNTLKL